MKMLQAAVLFAIVGVVTAQWSDILPVPVQQSQSCAATLCLTGTECREVYNPTLRVIEAQCLHTSIPQLGLPIKTRVTGQCPSRANVQCRRVHSCSSDRDCSPEKCCENACGGFQCTAPVSTTPPACNKKCPRGQRCELQVVFCFAAPCPSLQNCVPTTPVTPAAAVTPVEKPGQCRPIGPGEGGGCANVCSRDADCSGAEKCCRNGCGTTCQVPVTSRTPSCATVRRCQFNEVCEMRQVQCIQSPCNLVPTCVPRVPAQTCPVFAAVVNTSCKRQDKCSLASRNSCARGQSCCSTPCGNACF